MIEIDWRKRIPKTWESYKIWITYFIASKILMVKFVVISGSCVTTAERYHVNIYHTAMALLASTHFILTRYNSSYTYRPITSSHGLQRLINFSLDHVISHMLFMCDRIYENRPYRHKKWNPIDCWLLNLHSCTPATHRPPPPHLTPTRPPTPYNVPFLILQSLWKNWVAQKPAVLAS